MIHTIILATYVGLVHQPNQEFCDELLHDYNSALDVKRSDLPAVEVDTSKFFQVKFHGRSIPIPAVEYDRFNLVSKSDGLGLFAISSTEANISIIVSTIDFPTGTVGGVSTYEEWFDLAYTIDRNALDCKEVSPEFVISTMALLYKGFDGDMCNLKSAHKLNWGWLFRGEGKDCNMGRDVLWKVRYRVEGDTFFEVKWSVMSGHGYETVGNIFNDSMEGFSPTPHLFKQLAECINKSSAECLQLIEGIEVKILDLESLDITEIPEAEESNTSLKTDASDAGAG